MSFLTSIITIINTAISPIHINSGDINAGKFNNLKKANVSAKLSSSQAQMPKKCVENCSSKFEMDKFIDHLNENAENKSKGKCAKYVRKALEAGGLDFNNRPESAKDYGSYLEKRGFEEINQDEYSPKKGDVIVINGFDKKGFEEEVKKDHPHGHIQVFNGEIWVSDFKQSENMWPGNDYMVVEPDYKIYRMP